MELILNLLNTDPAEVNLKPQTSVPVDNRKVMDDVAKPEPVSTKPQSVASVSKPVAFKSKLVASKPEPVLLPKAVVSKYEPVSFKSKTVALKQEPVFFKPKLVASKPEPVSFKPQAVASEPEPVSLESKTVASKSETLSLPETVASILGIESLQSLNSHSAVEAESNPKSEIVNPCTDERIYSNISKSDLKPLVISNPKPVKEKVVVSSKDNWFAKGFLLKET